MAARPTSPSRCRAPTWRARWSGLNAAKGELKFSEAKADTNVAKISVIGVGMRSHAGVALKMFETWRPRA
jgi:aspartokinase